MKDERHYNSRIKIFSPQNTKMVELKLEHFPNIVGSKIACQTLGPTVAALLKMAKAKTLFVKISIVFRAFMFGNLVAISHSGFFNDIIWTTVYHRESQLQNGFALLYLEFATEVNSKPFLESVELLVRSEGSVVIAESPTYYMSYRPVLKAIQSLDESKMPFKEELIYGKESFNDERLYPNAVFTRSLLFKGSYRFASDDEDNYESSSSDEDHSYAKTLHKAPIKLQNYVDSKYYLENEQSILDESQTVAIKQLLNNRIAIVQGPPGDLFGCPFN